MAKLTEKQKVGIRRAVAELTADYITDSWGEPLKDVDQSDHWPCLGDDASDEDRDDLWDACNDYLDTAARRVAVQLRKLR